MQLVIDNGNSAAKVGIFDDQKLISHQSFRTENDLSVFLQTTKAEHVIVSSVKTPASEILQRVSVSGRKFMLDHTLPLPIRNQYKTPNTLGVDRLAGVCGAQILFPSTDCLVIDSGTCITYDFIDREKNFLGGGISPGLQMRFKAMHTFTARLPLITPVARPALIGDSTESCMQSGAVNGMIAEIDGIINQYRMRFPGLQVILCGGDTQLFENQLKASIFASPELVLIGLNSILSHNVNL